MKTAPKLVEKFDSLSLNLGNSRTLTVGRGGMKASGVIPAPVFQTFCKVLKEAKTYGEGLRKFAAEIDSVWPDWNKAPRQFKVGETVSFDFGPRRGGPDMGTVVKADRSVTVRFARSGLIKMSADLLSRGK